MSFLIELDEGTAAERRVPMRLFTSDGTSPDTGASDDTVLLSINGGAQTPSAGSVSAVSANAGMYYTELSQANVGTLGSIAVWHDDGDFPQHVATVQVVNFNPLSSQSNLDISGNTIAGDTNTATLIGALNDIDGSGVTLHAGTHSNVTIQGVTLLNSAVSVRPTSEVSGNIQKINNVTIVGDGSGTPFNV